LKQTCQFVNGVEQTAAVGAGPLSLGYLYNVNLEHPGLGKHVQIRGYDRAQVQSAADHRRRLWDQQWQRRCALDAKGTNKASRSYRQKFRTIEACERSEDAQIELDALSGILGVALAGDSSDGWKKFYDDREYPEPSPPPPVLTLEPEISAGDARFAPKHTLFARLLPSVRRNNEAAARDALSREMEDWRRRAVQRRTEHDAKLAEYQGELAQWKQRKAEFESGRAQNNRYIDALHARYTLGDKAAVEAFANFLLLCSDYPASFQRQWRVEYSPSSGSLLINRTLPKIEVLPTLKSVRYNALRETFEHVSLCDAEVTNLYEDVLFQTCLRTAYEVFSADSAAVIRSVTFNGWLDFDRAERAVCVASLDVRRQTILAVDLRNSNARAVFRSAGGRTGSPAGGAITPAGQPAGVGLAV
jgi:restriction system protein